VPLGGVQYPCVESHGVTFRGWADLVIRSVGVRPRFGDGDPRRPE
jgi:hypothetical protein